MSLHNIYKTICDGLGLDPVNGSYVQAVGDYFGVVDNPNKKYEDEVLVAALINYSPVSGGTTLPSNITDALGITANGPYFPASSANPFATQQQIDNFRDGGVFAKSGATGSIGGFVMNITDFSAAVYIDNIDNDIYTDNGNPPIGNILTFSTTGPSYSIPLSSMYSSYGWLNITYEQSTNTLTLYYPGGGGIANQFNPPNPLGALTNITNSFQNGYIRKAYFWHNQILTDSDFYNITLNDGIGNKDLFIGAKAPRARFEPYSIAYNGTNSIWYDTSGNGNDAVILGLMVDPKPWVSFTNLASILPLYLEKSGGIMTGNLTVGDNILGANNIVGENLVIQYDNLFLTTPNTTFVFPITDGILGDVLITDGSGNLQFTTLTKDSIGLSNVDNTSDVDKPLSNATLLALNSKEDSLGNGTISQYLRGDKTWQTLNKSTVGLSNVDNTSDLNKPISNATQTALNGKLNNPLIVTATTTTNVLTPLFTTTIPLNTSRSIRYHLKGRDTAGNTFGAECFFVCRNIANTTTLVGTITIDRKSNFNNAVQTSVTFAGANATINITAGAGVTTQWELYVREII